MTFSMGVDFIDRLKDVCWWNDLSAYTRDQGEPLFIGVRHNYLSVYLQGKAVFKKILQNQSGQIVGSFDRRYWHGPEAKEGDIVLTGTTFSDKKDESFEVDYDGLGSLKAHIERVKRYGLVNEGDEMLLEDPINLAEKACLSVRACDPSTINLEMTIPGYATRIDRVHLEGNDRGVSLIFTEAKLFSNTRSLRKEGPEPAPVVEQIKSYQRYLEDHRIAVIKAYSDAIPQLISIREQQGIEVSRLLRFAAAGTDLKIDTNVRLLIFRTADAKSMSEKSWEPHHEKLANAGLDVEQVGIIKENGILIERPWKS